VAADGTLPVRLAASAHPNPASSRADIRFDLPRATKARLTIYDVAGREVARLADGFRSAGRYSVRWAPGHAGKAGLYLYRLQTTEGSVQGRLVILH
jgi:hypothetical protein